MNHGPHNQNSAASEAHIQALRDAFGSDLAVESLAAEAPPAAAVHQPPPSPPAARSGAWQPSPPTRDRPGRVTFEAQHICGHIHRMTGWSTATPGIVVFRDGPPNTPCRQASFVERWHIWQLPGYEYIPGRVSGSGLLMEDFEDPESAIYEAGRIGRLRAGELTLDDLGIVIVGNVDDPEPPSDWHGPAIEVPPAPAGPEIDPPSHLPSPPCTSHGVASSHSIDDGLDFDDL